MPIVGTMWICDTCGIEIGFSEQDRVCFVSYQHPLGRGTKIFCLEHARQPLESLGVDDIDFG